MICIIVIGILLSAIDSTSASASFYSYNRQDLWGGICVTGNDNKQSPINIKTQKVDTLDLLTNFQLSSSWYVSHSGQFINYNGYFVKFFPSTPSPAATLTTHTISTGSFFTGGNMMEKDPNIELTGAKLTLRFTLSSPWLAVVQ